MKGAKMPSLSDPAIQGAYVSQCQQLWTSWAGFGAGPNATNTRRLMFLAAINGAIRGCGLPAVTIESPANGGCYLHADRWAIEFAAGYLDQNVNVDAFGGGASTLYHEARHAEQWYRIAQGIAAGKFLLPTGDAPGPKPAVTAQSISQYCYIALGTAMHAFNARLVYPRDMDPMITKWYRSIFGFQRQNRGQVLQHLDWSPYFHPAPSAQFAQYLSLAEEKDAFEVQDAVLARIANALQMWV